MSKRATLAVAVAVGVLFAGEVRAQTVARFTSVSASTSLSGYPASNANDGNYGTRWAARGAGQSLTGDLGRVATVTAVGIGWYQSGWRSYAFRIEVAGQDGVFRTVLTTRSRWSSAPQQYNLTPVQARFVRIVVTGSTSGEASITEAGTLVSSTQPEPVAVSISPTSATLAPGATRQFAATVTGATDTGVTWSVAEGAAGGTVSSTGLYTAPSAAGTYRVVATSRADSSRTATATVTVQASTPTVSVSISPTAATVTAGGTRQFSATVTGASDTGVTWSVVQGASGGTITSTGLYTAPSAPGTYQVRATSRADSSRSATATVTVQASTPTVSVSIAPTAATVSPNGNRQFSATVTGASDTSVTWSVAEGAAGGAVSSTGLYTAPATPGTYHVVATSRADATRSATSTVTVSSASPGRVLAFPGAEGFGAHATGGRGGRVIKVTNLNASGAGSLQAALDATGPRIIVFAVSGVIRGNVRVNNGDVTIAGQTAPGGGITIAGTLHGRYAYDVQNIVIRHVRVRPPRCGTGCDGAQYDAIQFSRNSRLILDHVSVAYGADETIDLYEADDVTIQWTTIEPSQQTSAHPDGTNHNYGIIHGPNAERITFHHNLCAHHSRRCPAIANGPADVRNNVAYNVRHAFMHTNPARGNFNFVGNYFKQGPNDSLMPYFFDDEDRSASTRTSYYLRDSYVDDPGQLVGSVDNPWSNPGYFTSLTLDQSHRSTTEFDFSGTVLGGYPPVTTQGAQTAYDLVLSRAGAFPRDGFTTQTVDQTRARTGSWNPALPADLMAGLTPGAPPADADNDGMADAWEQANGLNPADGSDHARVMASGYTAVEEYVNGLAAALAP